MAEAIAWAVVYTDRTVRTSGDGPPESAPRAGVQCVVQADPAYGYIMEESGYGAWVWRDDMGVWFGVDEAGLWQYRLLYEGRPLVIYGERLTDERFAEIRRWADTEIGQKSAWRVGERRG